MSVGTWIAGGAAVSGLLLMEGKKIALDADRLNAVIIPAIHSINLKDGIILRLHVKLQNPSKRDFDFTQPFIEIKYNGNTLGTSQAKSDTITVPANDEASFKTIMITIPWTNLLFLGLQAVKDLKDGTAAMECEAKATSYTTIFWMYRKQVTYSKKITIRREQNDGGS